MSLFQFELAPLEAIEPWGTPPDLSLHWFGLSYGSYHLDLGAARLLEYVEGDGSHRFVEYQLARFHEDVLSILPEALEPIPPGVTRHFRDGSLGSSVRHVGKEWESLDDADLSLDSALIALGSRQFDTMYLNPGPEIWIWSYGTKTVIEWDNRDRLLDGRQIWTATQGRHELARDEFVDDVRAFDRRLMETMEERILQVRTNWTRPDVKLDVDRLEAEQVERRGWLDSAMRRSPRITDWQAVQTALSHAERMDPD